VNSSKIDYRHEQGHPHEQSHPRTHGHPREGGDQIPAQFFMSLDGHLEYSHYSRAI
jgi:hypothetical protein